MAGDQQVLRGFIANIDVVPPLIVTFQFNPESVSDDKAVNYTDDAKHVGSGWPGKVYTGGGDRTITFDLKLHGLEQDPTKVSIGSLANKVSPAVGTLAGALAGGVSTELAKLRSFLYPKSDAWAIIPLPLSTEIASDTGRPVKAPPTCLFGFGTKILECVVTGVTITETQFNAILTPVRADVRVTLVVIEDGANPFYKADQLLRNLRALLGLQNVRLF